MVSPPATRTRTISLVGFGWPGSAPAAEAGTAVSKTIAASRACTRRAAEWDPAIGQHLLHGAMARETVHFDLSALGCHGRWCVSATAPGAATAPGSHRQLGGG